MVLGLRIQSVELLKHGDVKYARSFDYSFAWVPSARKVVVIGEQVEEFCLVLKYQIG